MEKERWFTFTIIIHRKVDNTDDHEAHEFKDCSDKAIADLRNDVWTRGVRINLTPTSWEVLCPFMIKSVFIILQDKKYAP